MPPILTVCAYVGWAKVRTAVLGSGAVAVVVAMLLIFSAGFFRSISKVKATSLLENGFPSDHCTPSRMPSVSFRPPSDHCDEVASHGVPCPGRIGVYAVSGS